MHTLNNEALIFYSVNKIFQFFIFFSLLDIHFIHYFHKWPKKKKNSLNHFKLPSFYLYLHLQLNFYIKLAKSYPTIPIIGLNLFSKKNCYIYIYNLFLSSKYIIFKIKFDPIYFKMV